jgi:hypothetical protein
MALNADVSTSDPNLTVLPTPESSKITASTPSIIALNPQIANTLLWVGAGVIIGLIIASKLGKSKG